MKWVGCGVVNCDLNGWVGEGGVKWVGEGGT